MMKTRRWAPSRYALVGAIRFCTLLYYLFRSLWTRNGHAHRNCKQMHNVMKSVMIERPSSSRS